MSKRNQNYKDGQESPFNKGAGARSATGGSLKDQNGITLIALVITIIIMLILVAVTISMAVNGGLFEYAGKAVGDMQNEIDAEQQLANGKIKIGDKWYASIDDYLNNKPITTGLEITPTEITLKKKETEEVEGEEVLSQTITASIFGMEKEPEITWETSSDAITLSATTGKTVTVTAVGTQKGVATVTAKCTYEGEKYTATSEVTLKILKEVTISKGAFVEYGVAYTDAYISKDYTTTNGWRLLDYTDNGDGTISNVKLISTGIPAKLYYYYNDTTNSGWYVKTESSEDESVPNLTTFKSILGGEEKYVFYTGTSTYYSLRASAGMYYNFGDIKFAYGTSDRGKSLGYFTSITVHDDTTENGTTYNVDNTVEKTGKELFKVGDYAETVRLLTLREVNEAVGTDKTDYDSVGAIKAANDSTGLYRLDQLSTVTGMSEYSYSTGYYWLASPYPDSSYSGHVCGVDDSGGVNYNIGSSYYNGVRPVVILDSDVTFSVDTEEDGAKGYSYLILMPEA